MWPPSSRRSLAAAARHAPAAGPGAGWMGRHRPIGRSLMTLAITLLAGPALLLDAAAPAAADGSLVAWHALSTAALAGLALWSLWTPHLPREAGRAIARGVGLLVLAALAVAAQRLSPAGAPMGVLVAMAAIASSLLFVGARWARQEIDW